MSTTRTPSRALLIDSSSSPWSLSRYYILYTLYEYRTLIQSERRNFAVMGRRNSSAVREDLSHIVE
jgi:hypothetical protein